jgi:hypothetical protein
MGSNVEKTSFNRFVVYFNNTDSSSDYVTVQCSDNVRLYYIPVEECTLGSQKVAKILFFSTINIQTGCNA